MDGVVGWIGSGDAVDEGGGDIGAVFFGSALTRIMFFFGDSFSEFSFWIGLAILIRSNGVDCVDFSSGVGFFSSDNDAYNTRKLLVYRERNIFTRCITSVGGIRIVTFSADSTGLYMYSQSCSKYLRIQWSNNGSVSEEL